jgi:hypothetical protein
MEIETDAIDKDKPIFKIEVQEADKDIDDTQSEEQKT